MLSLYSSLSRPISARKKENIEATLSESVESWVFTVRLERGEGDWTNYAALWPHLPFAFIFINSGQIIFRGILIKLRVLQRPGPSYANPIGRHFWSHYLTDWIISWCKWSNYETHFHIRNFVHLPERLGDLGITITIRVQSSKCDLDDCSKNLF